MTSLVVSCAITVCNIICEDAGKRAETRNWEALKAQCLDPMMIDGALVSSNSKEQVNASSSPACACNLHVQRTLCIRSSGIQCSKRCF